MKQRLAYAAFWTLHGWFAVACELTGHWHGCALLNAGPIQWAWAAFGHYGEYGVQPALCGRALRNHVR